MTITVPDELAAAVGLTEASAKLELAGSLYRRQSISLGKAAELAGLGRFEFQRALQQHGVALNYGVKVLRETGQL
jgi:predicted HTH domain antitoxin